MCLRVEKLFQSRRNHRIEHIVVGELSSLRDRSWCHKFVNWFGNLNLPCKGKKAVVWSMCISSESWWTIVSQMPELKRTSVYMLNRYEFNETSRSGRNGALQISIGTEGDGSRAIIESTKAQAKHSRCGKNSKSMRSQTGTQLRKNTLNEVEVAEVREVGNVGADRTGGKRENGTFNNNMSSEMEMSADEYVTQTPFHFEPMRCAHIGKVHCCMNCALWCAHQKDVRLRAYSQLLLLAECEAQIQQLLKQI